MSAQHWRSPMPDDELTPRCGFCDDPNIGLLQPAYLMLRGNFVYAKALGHEVFVFDKALGAEFIQLPDGSHAVIVDAKSKGPRSPARVVHEDCADKAVDALHTLGELHDESSELDEDDEEPWDGRY